MCPSARPGHCPLLLCFCCMYGSKAMQQLSQTSRGCLNLHIPAHHYLLTMLQPTLLELLQAIYYMITRNWKNSSSVRWIHQPFVAASRMVFIVQQNGLPQSHPKTQKRPKLLLSQYSPTLLTIDLTQMFLSIPTVQYICTYWGHVQTSFGG